jgi:hypothetical protein
MCGKSTAIMETRGQRSADGETLAAGSHGQVKRWFVENIEDAKI